MKNKADRSFLKSAISVIGIFSATLAGGTDYFVSTSGYATACSADQPCKLTTAITDASDGDRIILAGGTYTGTGNSVIELTNAISLYGGWNEKSPPVIDPEKYITIISGNKERRVIEVNTTGISLTLDGLHIVDGNATGLGGYRASGYTYDVGGGIFIDEANVSIENCVVEYNSAVNDHAFGGGIFLHNSDGRINNSEIRHNSSRTGGGIAIIGGAASVTGNKITSNDAARMGGGIHCEEDSTLISKNLVTGNHAFNGGGVEIDDSSAVLENNLIRQNHAEWEGGGVALYANGTGHINNIVADNSAGGHGGGIWAFADGILKHTTFADNHDSDGGTGIYLAKDHDFHECNMTLINTIIANEEVGVYITDNCHASMEGTLFWGNRDNIMWTSGATVDPGSVTVTGNPAFRDPANGDYHITGFSAAIDAGVGAGVTEDIDGDPRPRGSGYDIGADETRRDTLTPLYFLLL